MGNESEIAAAAGWLNIIMAAPMQTTETKVSKSDLSFLLLLLLASTTTAPWNGRMLLLLPWIFTGNPFVMTAQERRRRNVIWTVWMQRVMGVDNVKQWQELSIRFCTSCSTLYILVVVRLIPRLYTQPPPSKMPHRDGYRFWCLWSENAWILVWFDPGWRNCRCDVWRRHLHVHSWHQCPIYLFVYA